MNIKHIYDKCKKYSNQEQTRCIQIKYLNHFISTRTKENSIFFLSRIERHLREKNQKTFIKTKQKQRIRSIAQ